jgi:hypothetical protein
MLAHHRRPPADPADPGGMTMIVRRGGKYVVISETTGRRFGTYDTLAEAEKRLRQIEFFKHLRARTPVRRSRRSA